jgi:hypothetical protein
MAKQQQKQVAKKVVETGRNSYRSNGKAWKRRVCGDRHSPTNCTKCVTIYTDRHNANVAANRAKKAAAASVTA